MRPIIVNVIIGGDLLCTAKTEQIEASLPLDFDMQIHADERVRPHAVSVKPGRRQSARRQIGKTQMSKFCRGRDIRPQPYNLREDYGNAGNLFQREMTDQEYLAARR